MIRRIAMAGLLLATAALAGTQAKSETAVGRWKGESVCTVKPSACHDEIVVYDITRSLGNKGMLSWKADKIVNGRQENMGTLECSFSGSTLTCDMPGKGTWQLTVRGDSMTGTLKLPDGTLFRKVNVRRVR